MNFTFEARLNCYDLLWEVWCLEENRVVCLSAQEEDAKLAAAALNEKFEQ